MSCGVDIQIKKPQNEKAKEKANEKAKEASLNPERMSHLQWQALIPK